MRFHTSLPVRDIEATEAFYRVLFDSEPVKKKVDYLKFLPEAGGLNITFHQTARGSDELRKLHLGFEVSDQTTLDRLYERLERAGLVSARRETSICCYASQDKFWVTDPDGYAWELYVLLEDTEKKVDRETGCCASDGGCGVGTTSAAGAAAGPRAGGGCC